jgi:hypothetical protein
MQLQRHFAYQYKSKNESKKHYKYVITIPEEIIEELMWEEGEPLQPRVENNTLVVQSRKASESRENRK